MLRRLCLVVLCLWLPLAQAGLLERLGIGDATPARDDFLRVEQAFVIDSHRQGDLLLIDATIAPGYYLYRHSIEVLPEQARLGDWILPPGTPHQDEYFGQSRVFYRQLQLRIPLEQVSDQSRVSFRYQGCTTGLCYPPQRLSLNLHETRADMAQPAGDGGVADSSAQGRFAAALGARGPWLGVGLFFVLGLGLAFTPCVFPMYPILTGLIAGAGKLSPRRSLWLAFVYVQGMAFTYTLLGLVVASAGLRAQAALQHPAVLVTMAALFGVLALSMFGLFELRLPGSWQSRLHELANRRRGGSAPGVALMGMISGLVCSPCTTAPLSGALLYVAQSGDLWLGGLALYALSLGMGLPLLLLAAGSGRLLPRAGAWMEQVKVLFGFGLLAVAIIMLERLLSPELSRWLWLALAVAGTGYVVRHLRRRPPSARRSLVSFVLLFAAGSLLLGGWQQFGGAGEPDPAAPAFIRVKTTADLNRQLQLAREQNKTVMLDLYADWCVACKDFEQKTFRQPDVSRRLAQMVLLQADVTATDAEDLALLNRLGVLGLPTLVFYHGDGQEPAGSRITGFMAAAPFVEHLTRHRLAD